MSELNSGKKIEQGNILIREFTGEGFEIWKGNTVLTTKQHDILAFKTWQEAEDFRIKEGRTDFIVEHDFDYHENWSSLMPVVEKIENIELDEFKCIAVDIECSECEIKDYRKGHEKMSFAYHCGKTKIESVWNAVIQFIEWYNNEQSAHGSVASKAK